MFDEDLADGLRTELAEQSPPPARGGLAEVVGRGRRRRRTQQFGAALAVVVAVAGTAVAAATLDKPDAMPPADPASAWTRADLPALTPYGTWSPAPSAPPPAGRVVTPVPLCSGPDTAGRPVNTVAADADLQQRVLNAVKAVATGATVGDLETRHDPPNRPGTVDAYTYTADITDANGTGSIAFSVDAFTGDPLAAADEQAFDEFNCDPPKRHVLADGTVMQIYQWHPSEPFQSLTQVLRIYRPGGELYRLAVRNFGSPDIEPDPEYPGQIKRVGAGRATLPLTEAQLTDLAPTIATG